MESDANLSCDIPPDKCLSSSDSSNENISFENQLERGENTSEGSVLDGNPGVIKFKPRTYSAKRSNKVGCNISKCNANECDDTIVCGECDANIHYRCSKLPAYQLHRFLTARNYRKFVCELCCGVIPMAIVENCADSNSPNSITSIEAVKVESLWKNSGFLQFCPKSKTHPFLCKIYRRFHF